MTEPRQHSLMDDAQGLAYGSTMAAFAITLLTHLGLVTGQTAGLAVLLSYATGWSFGLMFFAVNIPFYYLGYLRMGLPLQSKPLLQSAFCLHCRSGCRRRFSLVR